MSAPIDSTPPTSTSVPPASHTAAHTRSADTAAADTAAATSVPQPPLSPLSSDERKDDATDRHAAADSNSAAHSSAPTGPSLTNATVHGHSQPAPAASSTPLLPANQNAAATHINQLAEFERQFRSLLLTYGPPQHSTGDVDEKHHPPPPLPRNEAAASLSLLTSQPPLPATVSDAAHWIGTQCAGLVYAFIFLRSQGSSFADLLGSNSSVSQLDKLLTDVELFFFSTGQLVDSALQAISSCQHDSATLSAFLRRMSDVLSLCVDTADALTTALNAVRDLLTRRLADAQHAAVTRHMDVALRSVAVLLCATRFLVARATVVNNCLIATTGFVFTLHHLSSSTQPAVIAPLSHSAQHDADTTQRSTERMLRSLRDVTTSLRRAELVGRLGQLAEWTRELANVRRICNTVLGGNESKLKEAEEKKQRDGGNGCQDGKDNKDGKDDEDGKDESPRRTADSA